MSKYRSSKTKYKNLAKEFDLCELEIAETINKYLSRASWKELSNSKKCLYMEIARSVLNKAEKYYELIPTFWVET